MDDVRDIRTQEQFTRTLDARIVRTTPFGRNASCEKAYKRAERLVSALHLLTNHVVETEPARNTIRKKSLLFLTEMLDLRDEMRGATSVRTRAVQSSIRELISLLRVLTISAHISYHNADMLIDALDELGNFLNASRRSTLSEDIVLGREDLIGKGTEVEKKNFLTPSRGSIEIRTSDASNLSDNTDNNTHPMTDSVKDIDLSSSHGHISTRGRNIMDTLRSGGAIGIKEICAHFPEYSEKMVQRELAVLVSGGIVKKTGLKRWIRYSL